MKKEELKIEIEFIMKSKRFNACDIIRACTFHLDSLKRNKETFMPKQVIIIACSIVGVSPDKINNSKRESLIVRFLTYDYYRRNSKRSLSSIGSIFGKDHATVLNSYNTYDGILKHEYEPEFSYYKEFRNRLNY